MPTAPRNPTQEMNSFSRQEKRNGARQRNTATGRATNISASRDRERRPARSRQPVAARPAGRAARTSRSGRARSRRRGTRSRCCGRASAGCRRPGRRDRRRESRSRGTTAASAEDDERAGGDERRMQALRQAEPVEREHDRAAAERRRRWCRATACTASVHERCAATMLAARSRNSTSTMVRKTANGSLVPDSTSSVAPTRGRSRRPRGMDEQENRSRVGRGDDRAHQQRLEPGEAQQVSRDRRGQRRRQQHAEGGEQPAPAPARCGRSAKRVRSPPSNRISASAMAPTR